MKILIFIRSLAITGILFVNANCKKQVIDSNTIIPPPQVTGPGNTAPVANAGTDKMILLPAFSCQLKGQASDKENNIISTRWRNISNTLSYLIHSPDSLETTVSNLEFGIYQFELSVTDKGGLNSKDTCKVTVGNTLLLENLTWTDPWYNQIEVINFTVMASQNPFKVYIKRDSNPNWIEVSRFVNYPFVNNDPYQYFIETRPNPPSMYTFGSLFIFYFGTDVSDTPDVKIEF